MSEDLLQDDDEGGTGHEAPLTRILVALARILQWQKTTDARLRDLSEKLVPRESFDDLKRRVAVLEGSQSWVVRTIVGAVLLAIVGGALAVAKSHGATP